VSLRPPEVKDGQDWSIEVAEALIASLNGVLSARIVSRPGGEIEEVHVLTSDEVSPKQTVRNVESALLAHFELPVDHRKISVAQTSRPIPIKPAEEGRLSVIVEPTERHIEPRILFRGQKIETEGGHRVVARISIEWNGEVHTGSASAADLPRNRLEAGAEACLRALESVAQAARESEDSLFTGISLTMDGVKVIDAFDDQYVLVAVNAMAGRDVLTLTGSCKVGHSLERAVVLATLQATDRWVRGRIS
jgi:hypothetical protein